MPWSMRDVGCVCHGPSQRRPLALVDGRRLGIEEVDRRLLAACAGGGRRWRRRLRHLLLPACSQRNHRDRGQNQLARRFVIRLSFPPGFSPIFDVFYYLSSNFPTLPAGAHTGFSLFPSVVNCFFWVPSASMVQICEFASTLVRIDDVRAIGSPTGIFVAALVVGKLLELAAIATSITKILKLPGSNPRVQAKAILVPSGLQDGFTASPVHR